MMRLSRDHKLFDPPKGRLTVKDGQRFIAQKDFLSKRDYFFSLFDKADKILYKMQETEEWQDELKKLPFFKRHLLNRQFDKMSAEAKEAFEKLKPAIIEMFHESFNDVEEADK